MDRALIISYLQAAEEQVASGDRQIAYAGRPAAFMNPTLDTSRLAQTPS